MEQATQLFVHCHGLDPDLEEEIANVMKELGLPVSGVEGSSGEEYVQMTNGFPTNDEYETKVQSLYERLQTEFDGLTVEKHIGDGPGYLHLPFDWIHEVIIRDEDAYNTLQQNRQLRRDGSTRFDFDFEHPLREPNEDAE